MKDGDILNLTRYTRGWFIIPNMRYSFAVIEVPASWFSLWMPEPPVFYLDINA